MKTITILFLFVGLYFYPQEQPNYNVDNIPEELKKSVNAVVRLDATHIDIVGIDRMHQTVKRVVTVFNKAGDDFVRSSVGYDKERKIKTLEAKVYDASGEELKRIKKKEFKDFAAVDGFSLYVDNRVLSYHHIPVTYPYTFEITYEIETSDTGSLPNWYFLSGYDLSVQESDFLISYASESLKPVIKESNLEGLLVEKEEAQGKIRYRASNIQSMEKEMLSPSFLSLVPRLLVRLPNFTYKGIKGRINDWKDVGDWMNNLLEGQDKLSEATVQMAKQLVSGIDDDLEKAKIIHKYVQESTRYISVQVGIGGLKPISAIEVDKVKYGDCKGLSNYTMALLKAVGVPSYYVVIEADNRKVDFYEDFADLSQGNHVIITIPYKGQYYWVDCTSQIHPFAFIGDFTDDRKALVIKPENSELVKTTAYLNKDNHQHIQGSYTITTRGDLIGDASIVTQGIQYDQHFYLEDQDDEDIKDYYKAFFDKINNLEVFEYSFENNKDDVTFGETVEMGAAKYATTTEDKIIFVANALNNNQFIPKRYRNRKYPFVIQRGYFDEDECLIKIPETYKVEYVPEAKEFNTEFGDYSIRFETQEDGILLKRSLFIKQGEYPSDQYGQYRTFRRNIAKSDNSKIILTLNTQ